MDDLKQTGSNLFSTAKQFVGNNKDVIYPFISSLLSQVHPTLGSLSGRALTSFGGQITS
jgi:hypothetical protein